MARRRALTLAAGVVVTAAGLVWAAEGYKDTPLLPGGRWHVHDPDRPQPRVVEPGTTSTPEAPGKPPSDAVVLFDGTDLSKWHGDKGKPAPWKIVDGAALSAGGYIFTNERFGDCQLHVEFATPSKVMGGGQGRGNSGVFFCDGRYEIQVLDCYRNRTYADGTTAALYGQFPPLVNACRKPGEWQTYDIIWQAPRFSAQTREIEQPAYATVLHNGVVVHHHTALLGGTNHKANPKYRFHAPEGQIGLQDHGNPVRYRNLWLRRLGTYDEEAPPAAPAAKPAPATPDTKPAPATPPPAPK